MTTVYFLQHLKYEYRLHAWSSIQSTDIKKLSLHYNEYNSMVDFNS